MAAVVTPGTPASMKTKIPLTIAHRSKRLKAKQQQTVQTEDVIRERKSDRTLGRRQN